MNLLNKGYEQHQQKYEGDNTPNDLPHIKYNANGTDGHISYDTPK